jgi:hypothetical protein
VVDFKTRWYRSMVFLPHQHVLELHATILQSDAAVTKWGDTAAWR